MPSAGQELVDGALRARGQLSAGVGEARDHIGAGRTRLGAALDSAAAATRKSLRNYSRQVERQRDAVADHAHELRELVAKGGRDGLAYSAGVSALAFGAAQGIATRMMKSASRHPYIAFGLVAGACYLIVRNIARKQPAAAKAADARRRAPRARSKGRSVRAKPAGTGTRSASA